MHLSEAHDFYRIPEFSITNEDIIYLMDNMRKLNIFIDNIDEHVLIKILDKEINKKIDQFDNHCINSYLTTNADMVNTSVPKMLFLKWSRIWDSSTEYDIFEKIDLLKAVIDISQDTEIGKVDMKLELYPKGPFFQFNAFVKSYTLIPKKDNPQGLQITLNK